jgi:hypothetical protein
MSDDIITLLCAKLATIGAAIPHQPAVTAYDPPPAGLKTANLPALFVYTGAASHNEGEMGENFISTTRRFYVQIAVIPTGQGDPNTREKSVRPLLEAALAHFHQYPHFSDISFVERVTVASDSGISILPEYGGIFIGFEIPIDIKYFLARTYATGE